MKPALMIAYLPALCLMLLYVYYAQIYMLVQSLWAYSTLLFNNPQSNVVMIAGAENKIIC